MSKLSYEDKINIYQERKSGTSITSIAKRYNINVHNIKYLIRLVDSHGLDILKTAKNKEYTKHEKEEATTEEKVSKEIFINNKRNCW